MQSLECLTMKCRTKECPATFLLNWQPQTELWKLIIEDGTECSGQQFTSNIDEAAISCKRCTTAYTPKEIARAVIDDVSGNPNTSATDIAVSV